jgi:hypothetical protein
MRITATGFGRDHGTWQIAECDIPIEANVNLTPERIQISVSASMSLNGKYWLRVELPPKEVSRLFYMTHRDKGLRDIVGILAELKEEEERAAEREARREAVKKAASRLKRI